MIFTRRALQRRLAELRATIGAEAVDRLAARLNRPGADRVAAMWEVAILNGLGSTIRNEAALPSGRRPDVYYDDGVLRFVADVTAVSDEGLDDQNPYSELTGLIEEEKKRLGLPMGGLDVRVRSSQRSSKRGSRTVLRLPPRNKLAAFVRDQIVPRLREQIDAGERMLKVDIDDEHAGLEVSIDTAGSRYSTGGYASYDVPTIKDKNPLYNALREKPDQLRGVEEITGVIVGDGDCVALSRQHISQNAVSVQTIIREFLRQYSSIDFVLILTVRDESSSWQIRRDKLSLSAELFCRDGCSVQSELEAVFRKLLTKMPRPVMTPVNGALRAREAGYDLGHHGGPTLGGHKIRMSSRELVETLAGLRTLADNGARNVEAARRMPGRPNEAQAFFLRQIQEGCLPMSITVVKAGEDDNDDWIEFEFGAPDPAISPFE